MVCPHCERKIPDGSEKCEYCGLTIVTKSEPEETEIKKSNVWLGTLGGLLGAIIGGLVIFGVSRLGYAASITGMILAFCTLKGYELLGKRLTRGGIMISMALIAVTPYIADRADWACLAAEAYGIDFLSAFMLIPSMLNVGDIEFSAYMTNLVILYLFCALGAYGTLRATLKKK